jgi:predicted DsbA family dithiol-disulfide isomerase
MELKLTCYLDVTSSWCYWAIPAWQKLRKQYDGRVTFDWKIALMDASGLPTTIPQMEWFYRRSGMIMRSPEMLNPGWYDVSVKEYLAPNAIAEAAKDFGINDERVWVALARAGLLEGRKTGDWKVSGEIGAAASGIAAAELIAQAKSPAVEERIRASTAAFHAMQITQRPAFVIDSSIGDRAIFSGMAAVAPMAATLDSMLDDFTAYRAHAAHFGEPPE